MAFGKGVPSSGSLATKFDVELENAVIEVTIGIGKNKAGQASVIVANTAKRVILYAPNLKSLARIKAIQSTGATVVTTLDELDILVKDLHP